MSNWKSTFSSDKRLIRADVCARYNSRCAYCNAPVRLRDGTVDHYTPQALGGGDELENLRWACLPCNGAKGPMHPEEWEARKPDPLPDTPPLRVQLLQRIAQRNRAAR